MSKNKTAIVVGANGMTAAELTNQLIKDPSFEKIILVSRRYIPIEHEKIEKRVIEFTKLHQYWETFSADVVFYCLGSTRKKSRKKAEFQRVEYQYCIDIAQIAFHNKVTTFVYLSCRKAGVKSFSFKNQVKGRLEEELKKIGFDALHILKPNTLFGKRHEARPMEAIRKFFLKIFNWMMIGFLKNIKGMPIDKLSTYMIKQTKSTKKGIFIHSNRQIHEYFSKKAH